MKNEKWLIALCLLTYKSSMVMAADSPAPSAPPIPINLSDPSLGISADTALLEEGKALYENGQLIAALGKFMTVLRKDPRNPDARQYLRMIIDIMRQNPAISAKKIGTSEQAAAANPQVEEEVRRMLQLRSRLTMDLKAIPMVQVNVHANVNQVSMDTALFFETNSGGLKEQGVPVLDRVAAWLKTFGQQPVIIHCYPEELQDASSNGSLFLRRYSELFNFFTAERKLPAQRFVSADLLKTPGGAVKDDVPLSSGTPRIVIETIGAQSAALDAMPSMTPGRTLSQWLENSITANRKVFNPEEGEWVNLDLAALSRTGLRDWTFTIVSVQNPSADPVFQMSGKGNLLKRLSWDGHDQKSGDFVRAGSYGVKLVSTNSDGTLLRQDDFLQVERTTKEEVVVAEKPKPKAKRRAKAKKPKVAAVEVAKANVEPPPPVPSTVSPPAAPPAPASDDSADSVHAIWKQVIQFETNQAELMPTVKSSLERIGKTLEVYPLQKVRITGFAMTSETNAPALAARRAETVRAILVEEYHVDAKRVIVSGGKTVSADNAGKVEMSITN